MLHCVSAFLCHNNAQNMHSFVHSFVFYKIFRFPSNTNYAHSFELLTVITSSGNKYNADKLIESSSFELNIALSMMQISSAIPLRWILVMVRLNINFGIEYNADVIHTPAITICKCWKLQQNETKQNKKTRTCDMMNKLQSEEQERDRVGEWLDT